MKDKQKQKRRSGASIAKIVLGQIETGGERIWQLSDFKNSSLMAVAQALSRLARLGIIQRLGKGLYYRPRQTALGQSKPNRSQLRSLPIKRKKVFPAGLTAANELGFSSQNPSKIEVSTSGLSLPRQVVGKEAIVHTRKPESWQKLSYEDAALLDFLRNRGKDSELSPENTVRKLLQHFREEGQFDRLFRVSGSEPPRVRAMLGAIGQQVGCSKRQLDSLRKGLNPLSRFDFGSLAVLEYARQWQAKE